ncbi:MAG TPA: 3-dehydro-L-gulonate 2-dehydrogenase [Terracidiphilus sp.]|jgi:3-dehydro-L-gulonate 2-dehydrogenase|nr:3-dehydro-L-gulonate 2-dehydrogenase [Terracidiphilus sp.]
MQRIPVENVQSQLTAILRKLNFTADRAQLCARLFTETTRDGVYSHGVNRFPRFVAMVRNGSVDAAAEPRAVSRFGGLERWDGQRGPGNLNAHAAMQRAIELSREHGIACVALANTNHWMRGGTYGWQAAEAGAIGICWTNTMPNLPPWGAAEPAIGNNPLVIAVPRAQGHVVLDMAMSQFSYGGLESYSKRGEMLPVDGGFDSEGKLTRDPAAIEATQRLLPIGYWKGSGLSVVLDMMAAMLSLGNATHQIATDPLREAGLSQMFVAMQPAALGPAAEQERAVDAIVESLHACPPAEERKQVRYPGEHTLRLREENRRLGLPIEPAVWDEILAM